MKRFLSTIAALGLVLTALVTAPAQATGFDDGMPGQKDLDQTYDANQAHWYEMSGGVLARPYVTAFTVINGATTSTIVAANNTDRTFFYDQPEGRLVVSIEPYNLCHDGVTPSPGVCYATPNRMSMTVGYSKGMNQMGWNLSQPVKSNGSTPLTVTDQDGNAVTINENTVFDITLTLNTIGTQLRWAQMYGHPEYWAPSNLGADNATIRLKMRPAISDVLAPHSDIRNCWNVTPDDGMESCPTAPYDSVLRANIMFSLEEGYGEDLTGAVFGVSHALQGEFCNGTYAPTTDGSNPYCEKTASPENPVMEFQMLGFHYQAGHDGNDAFLNEGALEAFLPAAMLMNTYGILPADAPTAFAVTRAKKGNWADSVGTFDAPTFDVWNSATEGSDGVLLTITGVTYSAPKFTVARKGKVLRLGVKRSANTATFSTKQTTCTKKKSCVVDLYKLEDALYDPTLGAPDVSATFTKSALKISSLAGTATPGSRFLITISRSNGDLVNSTTYTVPAS